MKTKILSVTEAGKTERYIRDPAFYETYDVAYAPVSSTIAELAAAGEGAEVLIADAIAPIPAALMDALPKLRLIHSNGVAYNGIDLAAARARGILVCNCRAMNATAVAEQALLLMLGLLRGVVSGDRAVREGRQMAVKMDYMKNSSLRELADCRVGFVGFGAIGQATAKLVRAAGAELVYYARHRVDPAVEAALGASYLPLSELLATSDIVSLHVPVNAETTHMADAAFFGAMKPGAYLINTARGELVEAEALLGALRSGRLAGAGLDTLEGEPVGADNPLLLAEPAVEDKLLLSCHVGGITASSFARGYEMIRVSLMKLAAGEQPDNVVF